MTPLDRPIWHALSGPHAGLAVGDARARRYDSRVSPFVACADDAPETLAAVAALVPPGDALLFLQRGAVPLPPGCRAIEGGKGVQMVAETFAPSPPPAGIVALEPAHWPEMLALALLTRPGPFREQTPRFGPFWGVRDDDGRLVAMAGTRLAIPGFTEVSGVCTHPRARGKGHAARLSAHVASTIARSGATPFLHAYADNAAAIRLYAALGFAIRTPVEALLVARA